MSKESKVPDSAKYGAGSRWRERGTGHKSRVAATVLTIALLGAPLGQAQAAQDIVLDTVPPVTEETLSGGTVEGRYLGDPTAVQLCSAVFIDGLGYFVKPFTATPEIAIMADGSFSFDSTTGGCDNRWERLALTVIPDLDPCPTPSSSPDPGNFITIVAQRIFDRQPRGVDFDGESLWVRDSGSCTTVGPGSNDFLRDNVRAQFDGLRIETSHDGSKLTSAEVVNREPTGYGRYVHEITLPEGGLDEATVLGIFSFDRDGVGSFFNEVDFEIGESLIAGGNAQCIVQGGDANIFTIDPADRELTVVLDWIPGAFACAIYLGHVADSLDTAVPLEEWTSTNNIPEPGADSRMRINLWIDDSATATPTSVIVKSVRWPFAGLAAAVLPGSRSVEVGTPATAFATIINLATETGTNCRVAPLTGVPADFLFQTTDPATNALAGTANTGVDIPGGNGVQTYVFAFTPTAAFAPVALQMAFVCDNLGLAPVVRGLNTLLLSASDTPVPDIVALAATLDNDGIVKLSSTGAFAVATVNVGGAGGMITASADTGDATIPVTISICETDPASALCLAAPVDAATGVTTQIDTGETNTFGIFVSSDEPIAVDPAVNRVFVRFTDAGGVVRGATSVAARTQ